MPLRLDCRLLGLCARIDSWKDAFVNCEGWLLCSVESVCCGQPLEDDDKGGARNELDRQGSQSLMFRSIGVGAFRPKIRP